MIDTITRYTVKPTSPFSLCEERSDTDVPKHHKENFAENISP